MEVSRDQLVKAFEKWNQEVLNKQIETEEYDGTIQYSESQADYLIKLLENQ